VMLGVVFTLGYLMGRGQYDTQLRAAAGNALTPSATRGSGKSAPEKVDKADKPAKSSDSASAKDANSSTPAPNADWDFYHSAEPAKPVEKVAAPPAKKPKVLSAVNRPPAADAAAPVLKPASRSSASGAGDGLTASAARGGKSMNSPLIPHGSTVLQVAALARQADALSLAQALQQKKFPAFVLAPDSDHYYRVQVGPYNDSQAANAARQRLENQGFKSIVKR
jgi:cell division septation protein DedD